VRLVRTVTQDGIELHGALLAPIGQNPIAIHIHGRCGNFYQNAFIETFIDVFESKGYGYLTMNTRGHDCISEASMNGRLTYSGGSLDIFDDCIKDIDAIVAVARNYSDNIILKGHSLGCQKVLEYVYRTKTDLPVVLMSPCNTRAIQEGYRYGELLSEQAERLAKTWKNLSRDPEWAHLAPPTESGFMVENARYPVPISANALLNALGSNMFKHLDFDRRQPGEQRISRGLVIAGGVDTYRHEPLKDLDDYFGGLFKDVKVDWVPEGDHVFKGMELNVAMLVAEWVGTLQYL
jgi:hypothetical protein